MPVLLPLRRPQLRRQPLPQRRPPCRACPTRRHLPAGHRTRRRPSHQPSARRLR
jgi:hypothetical protein